MKIGGLARNARIDAPTRLVPSPGFPLASPCHVSANVSKVVLCGRHNNLALFSEDQLNSSWQAQHFGDLHRHFVWQARHFRCVALPALH